MAKIRIENSVDKLLVTQDNKTSLFYPKEGTEFEIIGHIVTMTSDGSKVFSEPIENILQPKENSPRDLMIILNTMLVTPGSSLNINGLFDYNDLATATTPIAIIGGGGFTVLTNDEDGPNTNKDYPPAGVTDVWDADAGQFDFSQLKKGDQVDIRLDLTLVTASINTAVEVDLFLGLASPFQIPFIGEINFKSVGTFSLNRFNSIYMGSDDIISGGGQFKLQSDSNCDITVNGWYCRIIRRLP